MNYMNYNHCGFALLQYAVSLPEGKVSFENKNGRWVFDPNYVTLQIHYKRTNNIRISLRGNPEEFQIQEELPLKAGMGGYSECSFEHPTQMYAATSYIRRAWQIYNKGRNRTHTKPKTINE
jgi:hypothetical protein